MKVNKSQLVKILSDSVFKVISPMIKELIREEIDIEKKRFRKTLLEELKPQSENNVLMEPLIRMNNSRRDWN